jgi:CTP:phosphocholine cytidylyltransferase-like protein
MQYATLQHIDKNPQKIRCERIVEFEEGKNLFDLTDISKHVKKGEKFTFNCDEDMVTSMTIVGYRTEKPEEVEKRVERLMEYNQKYEEFNAKYRSNKPKINFKS